VLLVLLLLLFLLLLFLLTCSVFDGSVFVRWWFDDKRKERSCGFVLYAAIVAQFYRSYNENEREIETLDQEKKAFWLEKGRSDGDPNSTQYGH
jgi:hypothetical protein